MVQHPISLQTPVGDSDENSVGDYIVDESVKMPEENIGFDVLRIKLDGVMAGLNQREQEVLQLRFGLGNRPPQTLEEIGNKFNTTRERVRQIEAKALRKLRHPTRSRWLEGFL
jgi:RNA polymerase primary sigma factor